MMKPRGDERTIAAFAAGIYAGAALLGAVEALLPGGQQFSIVPVIAALVVCALTIAIGPRVPRAWLFALGPIGAAIIAYAQAKTTGYADGAVLYMWPVLWTGCFFGTRQTVFMVAWIGLVQAIALESMPPGHGNPDRWIDVVVSTIVVAVVVRTLAARNERMVADLTEEARVDPLTGVLNRRGLEERMESELSRAAREQAPLAVALFDLDHFKAVNDRYGHEIGDRVLTWLGVVLQKQIRGVDIVARSGGEEFVVVLPGEDLAAAHAFAERVRRALGERGPQSGRARFGVEDGLDLTLSGGVAAAVAPPDGRALIEAADRAMYRAKRAGRNRIVDADDLLDGDLVVPAAA
jgi:diguanylate cyclase (GGDEF)-like protein